MKIARKIFVFALLCCASSVYAGDFKAYLSYTNKAEANIITSNFAVAQRCYDSAFDAWEKPFAVDIINDLKCADLNKDNATMYALADRLVSLGCELSFFDRPEYLSRFRSSKEWAAFIDEYPKLRAGYLKKNNFKLRSEIEQLMAKDQLLRRQSHDYTVFKDSIYKADSYIRKELLTIFKSGFPNEYNYGLFLVNDSTLMDHEPLHLILLHNWNKFDTTKVHSANTDTYDFTKVLSAAVADGNMHPEEFALLNDRAGEYKMGKGFGQFGLLYKIKGKLYYDKEPPATTAEIDKNRQSIGLADRETARKVLYYEKKDNVHKFILHKSTFGISNLGDHAVPERLMGIMFVDTGLTLE